MGQEFFENFPQAREVLEEVDDSLQQKLSKLILHGPQEELSLTHNAQPAIMAVSMAILKTLLQIASRPLPTLAGFLAGHSLGEYTALASAASFTLSTTAQLLSLRGRAMQRAVPLGTGSMIAILGLELEVVNDCIATLVEEETCAIANDNCPGQLVISGTCVAIEHMRALAFAKGAKRVIDLAITVPSHCLLMANAAQEIQARLEEIEIKPPTLPIISNVTALPVTDPSAIQELLVQQLTSRVRWRESIKNLTKLGVTTFVEIGGNKVLAGLVKRTCPEVTIVSINTLDDMERFLQGV